METCHVSEETCYSSRETSAETLKSGNDCADQTKQRARIPGLQRDIEVLKSEILKFISEHGQEGFMPMRKQLRSHGRVDIEKAITRMGGFRRIAVMMNLSLAYKYRKPKGYWDNLENLQEEVRVSPHVQNHSVAMVCFTRASSSSAPVFADRKISAELGNGSVVYAEQENVRTCRYYKQ